MQIVTDVGLTGLYVDLGVVDPESNARFCLGVESDGPNYQSARWARDRDRLRCQILEDQGWKLLRVWAPDWFYRPDEEWQRLLRGIEAARAEAVHQT
jgi:very-short-patch-repair endonuclease